LIYHVAESARGGLKNPNRRFLAVLNEHLVNGRICRIDVFLSCDGSSQHLVIAGMHPGGVAGLRCPRKSGDLTSWVNLYQPAYLYEGNCRRGHTLTRSRSCSTVDHGAESYCRRCTHSASQCQKSIDRVFYITMPSMRDHAKRDYDSSPFCSMAPHLAYSGRAEPTCTTYFKQHSELSAKWVAFASRNPTHTRTAEHAPYCMPLHNSL
jgi:hypothetical protein